jgi:hypothetical protein
MAVDVSREGAVLSTAALNKLTNGNAIQVGKIDTSVVEVDVSLCFRR